MATVFFLCNVWPPFFEKKRKYNKISAALHEMQLVVIFASYAWIAHNGPTKFLLDSHQICWNKKPNSYWKVKQLQTVDCSEKKTFQSFIFAIKLNYAKQIHDYEGKNGFWFQHIRFIFVNFRTMKSSKCSYRFISFYNKFLFVVHFGIWMNPKYNDRKNENEVPVTNRFF